ncbi:MAG: hypothetical protein ACI4SH_04920 [Candidatus Scatosoma sp.]
MKKSKKIVAVFFASFALLCFAACGSCNPQPENPGETAHTHSMEKTERVEPLCEQSGNIEYWHCTECNKNYSDENGNNEITGTVKLEPIGHLLEKVEASDADCITMSNGVKEHYRCAHGCGKTYVSCSEADANAVELSLAGGTNKITVKESTDIYVFPVHSYNPSGICEICHREKDTASEGLSYVLSEDRSYYILTGRGTCTDSVIFIGSYNGKPVKEIGMNAFYGDKTLTAVVFLEQKFDGDSSVYYVEYVRESVFENCTALKNILFLGGTSNQGSLYGVKVIETDAFKGCSGLTVTYEGSANDWKRVVKRADLTAVNVVFKTADIVIPLG